MNDRKIQRKDGDAWTDVSMLDLKPGDTFRMFEHDGLVVTGLNGETTWVVEEGGATDSTGIHYCKVEADNHV